MGRIAVRSDDNVNLPVSNPLRGIGLGVQILEWKDDDDELYIFIRNTIVKEILHQVHSDKGGKDTPGTRAIIAAAMVIRNDRQAFDAGLAEMRRQSSVIAGEMAQTLESLRKLREQNDELKIELSRLRARLDKPSTGDTKPAQAIRTWVNSRAIQPSHGAKEFQPFIQIDSDPRKEVFVAQDCTLRLARLWVSGSLADTKEVSLGQIIRGYKELGGGLGSNEARLALDRMFAGSKYGRARISDLAREGERLPTLPELHWDMLEALKRQRPALSPEVTVTEYLKHWRSRMQEHQADLATHKSYAEAVDTLVDLTGDRQLEEFHLVPQRQDTRRGVISCFAVPGRQYPSDFVVVGCLAPPSVRVVSSNLKVGRDNMFVLSTRHVAEHILPYLFIGGVLVVAHKDDRSDLRDLPKILDEERDFILLGAIYSFS